MKINDHNIFHSIRLQKTPYDKLFMNYKPIQIQSVNLCESLISQLSKTKRTQSNKGKLPLLSRNDFQITNINQRKSLSDLLSHNTHQSTNDTKMIVSHSYMNKTRNGESVINNNQANNSKSEFIYNTVFRKTDKEYNPGIDNRLNIIYSENPIQYEKNYKKDLHMYSMDQNGMSNRRKCIGDKINTINKKVGFMKGISNFVYPSIVIKKITESTRQLNTEKEKRMKTYLSPSKVADRAVTDIRQKYTEYLTKSITVMNKSQSLSSIIPRRVLFDCKLDDKEKNL